MKPKLNRPTTLAVLITYHDEQDLLTACIDSILVSSVRPDEILIFDDASKYPATDYIPSDAPIRVIRNETNRGPGYGRNRLLRESTCEFVHFHDADDQIEPEWCQIVKNELANSDIDLVLTEVASYRAGKLHTPAVLDLNELNSDSDLARFCLKGSVLPAGSTMRRSLALRIGGYRTRETLPQSEDFDFHVRLAVNSEEYAVIQRPLVRQNLRDNSHSSDQVECFWSGIKSVEMLSAEIASEYHPELSMAATRMAAKLYQLGAKDKAKAGFHLAKSLGAMHYGGRGPLYEKIARIFGPMAAESFGGIYRLLVPENIRSRFH